jgi:hypothetical protein
MTIYLAWIVLIGLGLALAASSAVRIRAINQVKSWQRATGVVLSSTIKERVVRSRATWTEYSPDVAFAYNTRDGRKTSGKYSIDPNAFWFPKREQALALKNKYLDGASVDVHVCPTDPHLAVLSADCDSRRWSHLLAVAIGGAMVLLAGIVGICVSYAGA